MGRKEIIIGAALILLLAIPFASCSGILTAADWDDNNNYWHFEDYVDDVYERYPHGEVPVLELKDRVSLYIVDKNGDGLPNPHVTITPMGEEKPAVDTYGCYDGWFRFFPKLDGDGMGHERYQVSVSPSENGDIRKTFVIDLRDLNEDRSMVIEFEDYEYHCPTALDLAFVVDTTGSMSDELRYITDEFENIVSSVKANYQVESMRFGLVVYRDLEDEYVTRSYEFTDSVQDMKDRLKEQRSDGGGDYEEAVELGLKEGIDLDWMEGNTARMMFHVADAPPHEENLDETVDQIMRARNKGIHIYPIASSGVKDVAEFMMRLSEVLAHGRYLFLTDDSGVGNSHAEPHIPAYVITTLENLMVRLVESELRGKRVEASEEDVIRQVGQMENGTIPPSNEQENDPINSTDPKNGTEGPEHNETVNGTGPYDDPPLEGGVDHDYPDDEGEYHDDGGTDEFYSRKDSTDSSPAPAPPPPTSEYEEPFPDDPSWSEDGAEGDSDGIGDMKVAYAPTDSDPEACYVAYTDDSSLSSHPAYSPSDEEDDAVSNKMFSLTWILILCAIGIALLVSSITGTLLYRSRKRFVIHEGEE